MFRELNVPVLGVVENMSYLDLPDGSRVEVFGNGGGLALAEQAGAPFFGTIPMDPAVRKGGDEGIPVVISAPESATAKALTGIAEKIAAALSVAALQSDPEIKINMVG
jgi:ATP-binding protein involved in chromosome partitioning